MMESMSTMPEMGVQMAKIGWDCYLRFFQQWSERTGMTGAQGAANPCDGSGARIIQGLD